MTSSHSSSDDTSQLSDIQTTAASLKSAIELNDFQQFCRVILEHRHEAPDVCSIPIRHGDTIFHIAVTHGNIQMVGKILEIGVDVNLKLPIRHREMAGYTALHIASTRGNLEMVKFLTVHHAGLDAQDGKGQSSLHKCAHRGYVDITEYLCDNDANVNLRDSDGQSPLYIASLESHTGLIPVLITRGAEIDLVDKIGRTALHSAVNKSTSDGQIINDLLRNGACINAQDKRGDSSLHVACSRGNVKAAEKLLSEGSDINIQNRMKQTPLCLAANIACSVKEKIKRPRNGERIEVQGELKHLEKVCKRLIHAGAELNIPDKYGRTALHYAASWDNLAMVSSLLKRGAHVNHTDCKGRSPLHLAAATGGYDVIRKLMSRDADCNMLDKDGRLPLHEAVKFDNLILVQCLLEQTRDPHLADRDQKTPYDYAESDVIRSEIEKTAQQLEHKNKQLQNTHKTVCSQASKIKGRIENMQQNMDDNDMPDITETQEELDQTLRKLTYIADNPDINDITISEETSNFIFYHISDMIGGDYEELFTRLMSKLDSATITNYLEGIKVACDSNPFMKAYHILTYWKETSPNHKLCVDTLINALLDMGKASMAFKVREMAYNDLNKKRKYLQMTTRDALKCMQKITLEVNNMKQNGEDIPNELMTNLQEISLEVRHIVQEISSDVSPTLANSIACNRIFDHLAKYLGPKDGFKLYQTLMTRSGHCPEKIQTKWETFDRQNSNNAYKLVISAMTDWKQSIGQGHVDVQHILSGLGDIEKGSMADSIKDIYETFSVC